MGNAQSLVSKVVQDVPKSELSCVPLVVGRNCFGSILYPVTLADFTLAPTTDSILDGVIAGFPSMYARKVGKTSDDMYKACYSSYMSLQCTSLFPRCTSPQSSSEKISAGESVPTCLHMCILPMIMCPGFWVNDVTGQCSMVS